MICKSLDQIVLKAGWAMGAIMGTPFVAVEGRIVDGVVVVDAVEPFEPPPRPPDLCDDRSPTGADAGAALAAYEDGLDGYNASWVSPTGVFHLRVVGDAAPHQAALEDLGIAAEVCVVGGARFAAEDLVAAEIAIRERLVELDPGGGLGSVSAEEREDRVAVDVWRLDPAFRSELESLVDVDVAVRGVIEVIDGTLDDLEGALAEVHEPSEILLERWCGDVPLPVSTDPASLPPATEAESISSVLDAVPDLTGRGDGSEVDGFDWRIASASDDVILLIGLPVPDGPWAGDGYGTVRLERSGGEWVLGGFGGGCTPMLEAVGFETQALAFVDGAAPDPTSTTVGVLVNALFCGEQASDRRVEVVVVEEGDDEVALVGLADEFIGDDCAQDDWRIVEFDLAAPLGDRTLVDASSDARAPLAPVPG